MSGARWTEFVAGRFLDDLPRGPLERVWLNAVYQVIEKPLAPGWIHLAIKRRDRTPVHDWRDVQKIKNELVGHESEGVQLFPAESRLVDNANVVHLWCRTQGRFPFGFSDRLVSEGGDRGVHGHTSQRPWPEGERPADCLDEATMNARVDAYLAREREKKAGAA